MRTRFSPTFKGKTALVTGASHGAGAAAARMFAAAGAQVVLAAQDERALKLLVGEIEDEGGEAIPVATDVTDPVAVQHLMRTALDWFGHLDAAVNYAGPSHPPMPLADLALETFEEILSLNLRGTFLCLQAEATTMQAGGGGAIVNLISTAGLLGASGLTACTAAQHGIAGLTKAAALEYASQGIRINAVAAGPIAADRLKKGSKGVEDTGGTPVPLGRKGLPHEVAALLLWLCSDCASFVTGAIFPADGGVLAGTAADTGQLPAFANYHRLAGARFPAWR